MFGVPETIKLETVAAREAVNALNLTQKDLRHLKREFDEIDVDQSGWWFCVGNYRVWAPHAIDATSPGVVSIRRGRGWSLF